MFERGSIYLAFTVLEARPAVQIVSLLRFAVGVTFGVHRSENLLRIGAGLASWWLAVVAVYVFNGVMDFDEDVANGSSRPIARGDLPRRVALAVCAMASILALSIASFMSNLGVWLGIYLLMGLWYSAPAVPAKRGTLTASLAVFGLGWSSYAAGAVSAGRVSDSKLVVFGFAASAWMALVGTLSKDISDVNGDRIGGRHTLAVLIGPLLTGYCAAISAVLVGAASIWAAATFAPSVMIGMLPFAIGALWLVVQYARSSVINVDERYRYQLRAGYRTFMWSQYLANIAVLSVSLNWLSNLR